MLHLKRACSSSWGHVSMYRTQRSSKGVAHLDVDPFLLLEFLILAHQPLFRTDRRHGEYKKCSRSKGWCSLLFGIENWSGRYPRCLRVEGLVWPFLTPRQSVDDASKVVEMEGRRVRVRSEGILRLFLAFWKWVECRQLVFWSAEGKVLPGAK